MRIEQVTAYISAGSNKGDRERILSSAVKNLMMIDEVEVIEVSSLYETEPWGRKDRPYFLNCVIEIRTKLEPVNLFDTLRKMEYEFGRRLNTEKWSARELDLDILIYGETIIDSPDLIIPHKHLVERRFVLVPLVELGPDLVLSGDGITVTQALHACPDNGSVRLFQADWL
ncbi:2-amino-4-hydroxy-6-hydroxymethyldihydropteridine diphosphokinase [bacterium]|nr:2-amino-4-hydroxy-6-hydroxymethyldihydropteridine diphosphokinase [bacterium]